MSKSIVHQFLESGHSKLITDKIVDGIIREDFTMSELMDCFFSHEVRLCQRAAWAVGILGEKFPERVEPYLERMLERARTPVHGAIRRNVVRALQFMDISEKQEGSVYDMCMAFMADPKEAIAVRVFSLAVCLKICKQHPDLKFEIMEMVKLMSMDESPAIQSAVRTAFKKLKKYDN